MELIHRKAGNRSDTCHLVIDSEDLSGNILARSTTQSLASRGMNSILLHSRRDGRIAAAKRCCSRKEVHNISLGPSSTFQLCSRDGSSDPRDKFDQVPSRTVGVGFH